MTRFNGHYFLLPCQTRSINKENSCMFVLPLTKYTPRRTSPDLKPSLRVFFGAQWNILTLTDHEGFQNRCSTKHEVECFTVAHHLLISHKSTISVIYLYTNDRIISDWEYRGRVQLRFFQANWFIHGRLVCVCAEKFAILGLAAFSPQW